MFDQVQGLVNSKVPDTDVLSNTVRTRVKRVLPFHSQPFSYVAPSVYPPEEKVKELTQKPNWATVAAPFKTYPTGMGGPPRIGEKSVVKEKTKYLSSNPASRTDTRYSGNRRSDTDKNRHGMQYCQNNKDSRKFCGRKSKPKKYSDPSISDGSDSNDDRHDKPNRERGRSHCRKSKNRAPVSRPGRDFDPHDSSGDSSGTLLERSDESSGRGDFDLDGDDFRQKGHWSRLLGMLPWNELFARAADYREYKPVSNE